MTTPRLGVWVSGSVSGERRLVDRQRLYRAYCRGDPRTPLQLPGFISIWDFGEELRRHFGTTGSVRGFRGPVGVPAVNWDLDRPHDFEAALRDARRLTAHLQDVFRLEPWQVLVGPSGGKGMHIELPVAGIPPGPLANLVCRQLATDVAGAMGVPIDLGIYDLARVLRAWNSRHERTGLHKVRIDSDDLLYVSPGWIVERAREPLPFEPPTPSASPELLAAWRRAEQTVLARAGERRATRGGRTKTRINALTSQLMNDPISVSVGDRHRRIFAAAANLAEFVTIDALIEALLTEPGLDTGLPPAEVARQIRCGIDHVRGPRAQEEHG